MTMPPTSLNPHISVDLRSKLAATVLAECLHWLSREGLRQERHAFQ